MSPENNAGDAPGPAHDFRMRPRFRGTAPGPTTDFLEAIRSALERADGIRGSTFENSAVLKVAEASRHFWSPQLHLAVEDEQGDTMIYGRFSPHPTVWSGFLALYLGIAFSGIIGVVFGTSQWTLGVPPTGFIAGPAAIFLTTIVYAAAQFGRRLGRNQMRELSQFLSEATPITITVAPNA